MRGVRTWLRTFLPSVPLLRQDKCALDHVDARLSRADDDLDDVEAEVHLGPIEQAQPCAGTARDEFLLHAIHGIGGAASLVAGARFHLGENQCVLRDVAQHEVHLSPALRPEVPVKDFAAVFAEIALRELLAAPAECVARVSGRVPPGEPGEKTGDGLDKAHFF